MKSRRMVAGNRRIRMKYKALVDSYDSKRAPSFCVAGRVYEFAADPGKHFESLDNKPDTTKEELIAEAESLGMEVDRRKSVKTLQAEISDAKTKAELTAYGDN